MQQQELFVIGFLLVALVLFNETNGLTRVVNHDNSKLLPREKRQGNLISLHTVVDPLLSFATASVLPMQYTRGNPVLTGPTPVHMIFYGTWTSAQMSIIKTFVTNLQNGCTPNWFSIEKKYYFQPRVGSGNTKTFILGPVTLGTTIVDNYSRGTVLTGTAIQDTIKSKIQSGLLPNNPLAVYVFLTSPDVRESIRLDVGPGAFCSDYCGYHLSFLLSNKRYYWAFVGNPQTFCLAACSPNNLIKSPNGDRGVDAMVSVLAHELAEAMSDPCSDCDRAWQDSAGYENADKCAYTYGITQTIITGTNAGAIYNIQCGPNKYLIQQNWDITTGLLGTQRGCAMSA